MAVIIKRIGKYRVGIKDVEICQSNKGSVGI